MIVLAESKVKATSRLSVAQRSVAPLDKLIERARQPHEVAAPILFLLSDAASMISGAALPLDGG